MVLLHHLSIYREKILGSTDYLKQLTSVDGFNILTFQLNQITISVYSFANEKASFIQAFTNSTSFHLIDLCLMVHSFIIAMILTGCT